MWCYNSINNMPYRTLIRQQSTSASNTGRRINKKSNIDLEQLIRKDIQPIESVVKSAAAGRPDAAFANGRSQNCTVARPSFGI